MKKGHRFMQILQAPKRSKTDPKILVAIPSTGLVRIEWSMNFAALIQPVNWSMSMTLPGVQAFSPIGWHVAQARNFCVETLLKGNHEWIFFLDHDTIPPVDLWLRLNQYTQTKKYPIVCGIYYNKGAPSHPLVFRGRGNGCFLDWKRGDRIWVDGIPMGCTLIHRSIFEHLPKVKISDGTGGRGWFDSPRFAAIDPENASLHREIGTEDLDFCERVIRHKVLAKSGWKNVAGKKYPFLADSRIWCEHISNDGQRFPSFVPKIGSRIADVLDLES